MDRAHLSLEEMEAFTHGRLDGDKKQAVSAHLVACPACHEKQSQMAMAAIMARMQGISEQNARSPALDPFWSSPYPDAFATPPRSSAEIALWEEKHKLRLPTTLAGALGTQNGGSVRGTGIVICPLEEFQLLSEPKWDSVFTVSQVSSKRNKLLYVGFESQSPASIILNYSDNSEPSVLYLWHDLGDELRPQAESFDSLLADGKSRFDEVQSAMSKTVGRKNRR